MATIAAGRTRSQTKWMPLVGARNRRGQMKFLMLLADVAGFGAAAGLILAFNLYLKWFELGVEDSRYLTVPAFCLLLFLYSRLYPGVGINPAEEIRLVTQHVTTAFVGGWMALTWIQARAIPNNLAFVILWGFSIACILLARWSMRVAATRLGLWGEPVVVMGGGEGMHRIMRYFLDRRRLGYVPVMAVLDGKVGHELTVPMPVIGRGNLLKSDAERFSREGIKTLMVDVAAISDFLQSDESRALYLLFERIILVSDVDWLDGASMHIQDFEGMIGISTRKGVLTPLNAVLKRTLDIVLGSIAAVVLLPALLAAAIWIKLDSPGPVFYDQERRAKNRRRIKRPGDHGRRIRLYKYRTMFENADSALHAYLRTHPEAQFEWETTQKLRADPRVTRAGRFLRRFSIDEMPQLLNVIKGEMSLVGPRPVLPEQVSLYGEEIEAYSGVRPGMTGLWQVSGRNRTTFRERVRLDVYYLQNWSIWLDLYILLRTVWVVLFRDGAY